MPDYVMQPSTPTLVASLAEEARVKLQVFGPGVLTIGNDFARVSQAVGVRFKQADGMREIIWVGDLWAVNTDPATKNSIEIAVATSKQTQVDAGPQSYPVGVSAPQQPSFWRRLLLGNPRTVSDIDIEDRVRRAVSGGSNLFNGG